MIPPRYEVTFWMQNWQVSDPPLILLHDELQRLAALSPRPPDDGLITCVVSSKWSGPYGY